MNLQGKILVLYDMDATGNWRQLFQGEALDPVPFYEGMRILALETRNGEKVLVDFPNNGIVKIYESWDEAVNAEATLQRAPAHMEEMVRKHLAENRKIQAIKEVREITGFGLREAKDYVDRIEAEMRR